MPDRRLLAALAALIVLAPPAVAHGAPSPAGAKATAAMQALCLDQGWRCYSPLQVQRAYGLDRLHRAGIDGRGTTIAIIMNPAVDIVRSVEDQSRLFGLPKPRVTVVHPAGEAPLGEAGEPNIDLQAAHAAAPRARLLFLAVPGAAVNHLYLQDEPLAKAVDAAVAAGADVISMSFGGLEQPYPRFRAALARAAAAGVPAVTGSGDQGVTLPGQSGRQVVYPASDPNVTTLGATLVTLDARGRRFAPDLAWGPDAQGGASGGGVSGIFARPAWQRGVPGTIGAGRNYPDLSMLGAASSEMLIAFAREGDLVPAGGTSLATPLMAGVFALARQHAGRPLRHVNRAIYRLARAPRRHGIVDVVVGNNSYSDAHDGRTTGGHLVQGYMAHRGYDLVTGLGTIHAPRFVRALARAAR